ncbi:glutaredoxin family protein [Marinagarivorans cellulosilyticus]|uniref:Glutaredoxin domain-containing protein n=1 Tax=Marinagarivorans cellulosilyticus TaxID=2721545 RepID=A0AAN1WJN1_9GAMM|nr:glutaredoxin family protein [Marinagarivorans cellulosilyticus]BCD98757.1 hypothetical protein MARGE09_P2958 [Marinagarivorans cellulosilyticus]
MKPARIKAMLPVVIFFVLAAVAAAGIRYGLEQSKKPLIDSNHPNVVAGTLPVVTLYSTAWCSYCKAARTYFTRKNIAFIEKDIEKNPAAYQQYQQLGGNGVPFITINEYTMQGFDRKGFKAAYLKQL